MIRGAIKTLASVALIATTAGHIGGASAAVVASVDQQEQVTKFSDRFLSSLEEVDANDAAVAVIEDVEENAAVEDMEDNDRRLSWWSLALMFGE